MAAVVVSVLPVHIFLGLKALWCFVPLSPSISCAEAVAVAH